MVTARISQLIKNRRMLIEKNGLTAQSPAHTLRQIGSVCSVNSLLAMEVGQVYVSRRLTKGLVLDANILLPGAFGVRVRSLFEVCEEAVAFYSPDGYFEDARR